MSPPCAAALLLCLVGVAGCLYVEGINHPPVAALVITAQPSVLYKGGTIELDPSGATDPDAGEAQGLTFNWFVDHTPGMAQNNLFTVASANVYPRVRVSFLTVGAHLVEVVAVDPHGARSAPVGVSVTVIDAPPSAVISANGNVTACNDHLVGVPMVLSAKDLKDADAKLPNVSETITFQWFVTPPIASKAALLGPCSAAVGMAKPGVLIYPAPHGDQTASVVCLTADVPGLYDIALKVDDGARAGDKPQASTTVAAAQDRPACMDGWSPPPGPYVLDSGTPARLSVTEVLDDRDAYPGARPRFFWSVWHETDPTWRAVPSYLLPTYVVDPSRYLLDELVKVRVTVADRVDRPPPSCDAMMESCPLLKDYPNDVCFPNSAACEAWVTWDLRFR